MRTVHILLLFFTLVQGSSDDARYRSRDVAYTVKGSSDIIHSGTKSQTKTRRKRKKRRVKSSTSPATGAFLHGLKEDDFDAFPDVQVDDEDAERLLSALERIDDNEDDPPQEAVTITKKRKKKSRGESSSKESSATSALPVATKTPTSTFPDTEINRLPSDAARIHPNPLPSTTIAASSQTPARNPSVVRQEVTIPQQTYRPSDGGVPYTPRPQGRQSDISAASPQQAQHRIDQRRAMLTFTTPWVIQFLQGRPKDALLAIPRDFIADGFNLVHLPPIIESMNGSNDLSFPLYKAALRVILTMEDIQEVPPSVQRAAEALYCLVHARYITSPRGLDTARRLLLHDKHVFGRCPRPFCRGMPLLPHGTTLDYHYPGHNNNNNNNNNNNCRAQRYCCACGQVWEFWDSKVDGSAWGPYFCHLFLLTYGNKELGRLPGNIVVAERAVPTVFGFQIHKAALQRLRQP